MAHQDPSTAAPDRRFATTLARGLSVLRAFRADDNGLGNAELAMRTGLPRSTVSRLTFTLRTLGYLEQAQGDERYRPGPVLLSLGNVAAGAIPFVDEAAGLMQQLADDTGTLALLGVRDGEKMLLVRTWRPQGIASLWLEVGHRVPLGHSSSGAALLSALSDSAFAELPQRLQTRGEAVDASGWRLTRDQARRQFDKHGFVIADPADYFTPTIHAVAVPFHARQLAEPVVFTCGAMPETLTMARLKSEVGPALRIAVDTLASVTKEPGALPRPSFQETA